MKLHNNKTLFRQALGFTSDSLNILPIYVEKDYWITLALFEIFHSTTGEHTVFKGGTSLSKCYKIIERFSEDIDLVILRKTSENDNQLKRKIKAISTIVSKTIPEIQIEGITNKMGNIRRTVHKYERIYEKSTGQVGAHIIVEATWLGNFEPHIKMSINSYIYDAMLQNHQNELIKEYSLEPFDIQVLNITRTFCEKIMSLVRFSRTQNPIDNLRIKIRHIYDIHKMMDNYEIKKFLESSDFDKMLVNVGNDDMLGYKNNNNWIPEHPSTALIFKDPISTWEELSSTYRNDFKMMVTGLLPDEKKLIDTLEYIGTRMKKIEWIIDPNR